MSEEEYYTKFKERADRYIDEIIKSDHPKKLVLAGPGVGKSALFKRICENNIQNGKTKNVALSFINELIVDLKKDLHGLARVSTLHSFALQELRKTPAKEQGFFMKIADVINKDYEVINKNKIDFPKVICNLVDDLGKLEFYKKRRQYYKHFGPHCSIYTLIKYYEEDGDKIPEFDQLLVDEFQDFNKLEIRLIDLLSQKSSLLIAGDDDQSLYSFRHAYPDEIRLKYKSNDYKNFELPFCFRCPNAIVSAFKNIVDEAKSQGFLKRRVDNKYEYFPTKEKDEISKKNSEIIIKEEVFDNNVAFYIDKSVKDIFDSGDTKFSVLVITPLPSQAIKIKNYLFKKGFKDVQASYKNEGDINESLLDGLGLLLKDRGCNLGWRIVAEQLLKKADFQKALKDSYTKEEDFKNLLDKSTIRAIESLLITINKIKENKTITEKGYEELFSAIGYDPNKITSGKILDRLKDYFPKSDIYKNTPVKITNILGSKGLTKDYVFLVNFDDKYLIGDKGKITDEKICIFLVALTRAKKRVHIFSQKTPTFVEWINTNIIKKE